MAAERPYGESRVGRTYRGWRESTRRSGEFAAHVGVLAAVAAVALGAFKHDVGGAISIGVPFTHANWTWGFALGDPAGLNHALPTYLQNHVSNLNDGYGGADYFHWGPWGQLTTNVIGQQTGDSAINISFNAV